MFARRLGSRRVRARVLAVVSALTAATLAGGVGLAGAAAPVVSSSAAPPAASLGKAVTGMTPVAVTQVKVSTQTKTSFTPSATKSSWPTAASGTLELSAPVTTHAAVAGSTVRASGTPVWAQAVTSNLGTYTGPSAVKVSVQSHAVAAQLGISGVVWSLGTAGSGSGKLRVGLDYSSFEQAIGGNYASRLRLVELPACALTTPQLAKCRVQTPLTSVNTPASASVSALVSLGAGPLSTSEATRRASNGDAAVEDASTTGAATVLGATDSTGQEGGEGGNYAQDGLSSAGSWSQSGSSGDFTYTYTVATPDSSSALVPDISLSYDSGTVDGTTSTSQAQSSWVGDGWATQDSYVEQTYTPCDDDPEGAAGSVTTTDECYDGQILTLSLNGSSTAIVDDAGTYKLQNDDGAVVTKVTGADNGSGTYDNSYWKITEQDGTTYYFGRNELPGHTSNDAVTNSVDTERVYSAHDPSDTSGSYTDPCYNETAADSYCTMAYKWHLDYVVDAKSEAMAYYYTQDTNYYAADDGADNGSNSVEYVRDSYLAHIDYGFTTTTGAYGIIPDTVVYTTGVRCVAGPADCGTAETSSNASYYPDVPFDLECAAGATCSAQEPGFFSTVSLTSITTEQYSPTAPNSYATVDSYALTQTEPTTGDATSSTLWLAQIQRTAQDTTAGSNTDVTLPPVQFAGTALANRVDTTSLPSMFRYRMTSITNENGGVIGVTYGLPQPCTATYVEAETAATASSNTKSCFPVYWTPVGYAGPTLDWFEKYAVTRVTETDTTGGSDAKETDYTYSGAAWHYDDNETTKAKYRTYGQWRGYESVTKTTGITSINPLTKLITLYYQGMDGDYLSPTSTRSVSLSDSLGGAHADSDQLAGDVLETESYLGDGGPIDHFTIDSYWVSPATATRTRTGLPALTANTTGIAETYAGQHLTDGNETTWRYTETDTSYDATTTDADFGLPLHVYSHTVPVASAYDRCTTNTYTAANTSLNIVGLAGLTETDAAACSGFTEDSEPSQPAALNALGAPSSLTRPGDVVAATETLYDGASAITTAPTAGLVSKTLTATGYTSGAWNWQTDTATTYDTTARFSRPLTSTDGDGKTTTTAYTLNAANLTTGTSTTNALSQTSSVTLDPERGLTLTSTDPNGVVTTTWYDALGRAIDVWDYSRATTTDANTINTYTVSDTSVSGEVSETLTEANAYDFKVTITDSLGRTRQTQATTPQGGRLITDEVYDSRGLVEKKNNAYWDPSTAPTLALEAVPDDQSSNQDDYVYDGLGRVIYDNSENAGTIVSTTTTVYNGDSTTVIPPTGGVTKTTVADPLGRTSKVEEYSVAPTLNTPSNVNTGVSYLTGGTTLNVTTAYGFDATTTDATYGDAYTTTVDAQGDTSTSYTDLAGDTVEKVDPTAGISTMAYDADGNLTQNLDSRGDYVSYTYDALDRKTGEYAAASTAQVTGASGNQTAAWYYDNSNGAVTGMTDPIGHLTTEISYSGGNAYTTQYAGFNAFGESTGETVTVPSTVPTALSPLAGSYTVTHTYLSNTGLVYRDIYAAAGTITATEVLTHTYTTHLDLPLAINGTNGYLKAMTYDAWSRPITETLGISTTGVAYIADTYDVHTGLLREQLTTRGTSPADVDEEDYTYDLSGNITEKVSTRLGSSSDAETQCYVYDALDQLTSAWTATDNCATAPTSTSHSQVANTLGNSSAYWTSWTYDNAGNRLTQVQHAIGTATTDTKTTYTYSTTQPNTLASTSTTGASTSSTSYGYDTAGDTTKRDTSVGNQTLTWNNDGTLAKDTNTTTGTATSYIYDADGNLLLQIDPTTTTLYLEGQQLTLTDGSGSVSTTRYYQLPGGATVVRTGSGNAYQFEIADQQGTGDLYLDYTCQTPTWRQFDPYGVARGTAVTWIDNRTTMNQPTDATTALTDDGARYLDTALGRFISLDPVYEADDPLALGGYTYTSDNPVTEDDSSGSRMMTVARGGSGDTSPVTIGCTVFQCNPTATDSNDGIDDGGTKTSNTGVTVSPGHSGGGNGGSGTGTDHRSDGPGTRVTPEKSFSLPTPDPLKTSVTALGGACPGGYFTEASQCAPTDLLGSNSNAQSGTWFNTAWNDTVGGHWRGMLQAGGFVVCMVGTAGVCATAGLIVASATYALNSKSEGWGGSNLQSYLLNLSFTGMGYGASKLMMMGIGNTENLPMTGRIATAVAGGGTSTADDPSVMSMLPSSMGPKMVTGLQGLVTLGGSQAFGYMSNFYNSLTTCGIPQALPGYCN